VVHSVHALFFGRREALADTEVAGSEPTTVPAGYLTLEIEGQGLSPLATIDGARVPLALNEEATRGYLSLDLFRSVGFHRLEIDCRVFFFCTEDSKLRLSGVQEMLEYMQDTGLSWGYQLFFADGTAIRHPKVVYAWLTARGPDIIRAASAIAAQPRFQQVFRRRRERPGPRKVAVGDTLHLLRRNPKLHLELAVDGVIEFGGARYHPKSVITMRPEPTVATIGNRRVTTLLLACAELAQALQKDLPRANQAVLGELQANCEAALAQFPFLQLRHQPPSLPPSPAPEELSDARYQRSFELAEEMAHKLGWHPGTKSAPQFAFVQYADEIYQAFVALTLAHAYDAALRVPNLRPRLADPCFQSDDYDIFYDTSPPLGFSNWRNQSRRPAEMRPDLTIVDRKRGQGILVDAKYRAETSGILPTSALNDCQVYMQSFGVKVFAICYPGKRLGMTEVSGAGNTILEISLRPDTGLDEYLRTQVRPRVAQLMEILG
jgi:hypothetical protein